MSGSGLGPVSQLVPHCSCKSKLSSLESQAIRTPSYLRQGHVLVLAALSLFVLFSIFVSLCAQILSRMPQHPHRPTDSCRNATASSPLTLP
ncbi:hypothetical protein V6N11_071977 [Hibiscus sabdariffa]|uniref:Uncharacterized protein n=1 Tax=Hibiscus sabdariffa TaxID=183260 RepID=A0ABR2U2E3_9ROSI